jgi:hypothetical protein
MAVVTTTTTAYAMMQTAAVARALRIKAGSGFTRARSPILAASARADRTPSTGTM